MQEKTRQKIWREPPRGLFIHFVLLIKKRRLKSSQKKSNFLGSLHSQRSFFFRKVTLRLHFTVELSMEQMMV